FRRGRKLVLGGIEIPHPKGLIGHSDADVLLHALINALLGAMGESDIGTHFPDSDSRYKGISSTKLLGKILLMMRRRGFTLVNADVTVIAQEPKLAPYYSAIKKNVANQLKAAEKQINIKSTTTERLGWIGKGAGMAATAVILLRR
ncbi:MAG TPA: 2-C-methyl-D-erythritol 2,4-cyclodiphosphate synthase, partial [Candidatus Udaeobacter sp.]|nr:2-C-methyl-D-erythritol 2,4-cyclodiphosphate synthase [Candidatus Udaeobacter sp.]